MSRVQLSPLMILMPIQLLI